MELIYLNDDINSTINRILDDRDLENCGLNRENVLNTIKSFEGDEIATSVFLKKYALRDENNKIIESSFNDAKNRWAGAMVQAELLFNNKDFDKKYFLELYDYFLPGGRQMFGLGNSFIKNISYTNCYVTDIEDDSIEGIFDTAKRIAKTYSYGGGIGFCIGKLRPKDSKVSNTSKFSTGAVSFMELYSLTTGLIGQFGRRGALMLTIPIDHPDIEDFIEIKHGNLDKIKFANISIKITDDFMKAVENDSDFELCFKTKHEDIKKTINARYLWSKIIKSSYNSAEPGILFWDKIKEDSPSDTYDELKVICTNPCITGDTLIYVADGRGNVSIKELAENGNDVPVFCFDDNKKTTIRTMRNPRITGYKQPIYKITFDDGNSLRVTKNHSFLLKNGGYIETRDLKKGDSLHTITKFEHSINHNNSNYWWINDGKFKSNNMEHRIVAECFNNTIIKKGFVVHHKDFNSKNNSPENLQIISREDHYILHSENMKGDKNPMRRAKNEWSDEKWEDYKAKMSKSTSGENNGRWLGTSDEDFRTHAIILTEKLGYRFSYENWVDYAKENNLVSYLSKKRSDVFGGISGLSKWAANQCGLDFINLDPRILKTYKKLVESGYECFIEDNIVLVKRCCEICGNDFFIHFSRRECSICSKECFGKYMTNRNKDEKFKQKVNKSSKKYWEKVVKENGEKQINVFLDLKEKLERCPLRKEFENECKLQSVPYRIGKPSFFNTFADLKEHASRYNHRIISIEFDGYEDVYNGTVDEFHNFFVGGFEGIIKSGKKKFNYFNNLNCGEISLHKGGTCVLGSLLLHKFVKNPFTDKAEFDFELFRGMVRRSVRHLDNVVELNKGCHPLNEQEIGSDLSRRIGLGATGFADMFTCFGIRYDSDEALKLVDEIMCIKMEEEYLSSIYLSKERGPFPLFDGTKHYERGFCKRLPEYIKNLGKEFGQRNVGLSTIAPSGSLSIEAQCSSGLEPIYDFEYERQTMLGKDKGRRFTVKHPGILRYYNITKNDKLSDFWISAHNIDYKKRIKLQSVIQQYIDANISSTINLSNNISEEIIGEIYQMAWKEGLKGITVYREGSREGILISDNFKSHIGTPNMNTITHCVRAEAGDKFYIMVSYKDRDIKNPYQVFVQNYKKIDNESFIKVSNSIIKMLRTEGIDEGRIQKYIDRSPNSLSKITRFLSLSMKTGNLDKAVDILDEYATVGSLIARLRDIFTDSIEKKKIVCKNCGSDNIRLENGCMKCLDCFWEKCG